MSLALVLGIAKTKLSISLHLLNLSIILKINGLLAIGIIDLPFNLDDSIRA
jgi:hypothetical protein